jgi:hypothetical protein
MDSRHHDLETLRREYRTASPDERSEIERSGAKIRRESSAIRSMREALIKAHRDGNQANIRDIHEYIQHKQKYQNE